VSDLYLVTVTAVYDHGCYGVYSTLEAAKDRCEELWKKSDGHHRFRIDSVVLDEPKDYDNDVLGDPDRYHRWLANPDIDEYGEGHASLMLEKLSGPAPVAVSDSE